MKYILLITIFLVSSLFARDDFDRLNSSPTPKMLENIKNAKVCKNPKIAKTNIDSDFTYGCFCGKNNPYIVSDTKKSYKVLDRKERYKLIEKHYLIKPIDKIDESCMKHDLCYLYEGRADQLCNDILYTQLLKISNKFYEIAQKDGRDSKAKRCEKLASDIGVVFKTIFAPRENLSVMRFGMFMMVNTPMTIVSKTIQKASHGMNDSPQYPLPHERCEY